MRTFLRIITFITFPIWIWPTGVWVIIELLWWQTGQVIKEKTK